MSRAGQLSARRYFNVQKINPVNGRLIWSRMLAPRFWGLDRDYHRGKFDYINAVEVEPIHGTNDVVVRLTRNITNGDNSDTCQHVAVGVHGCECDDWYFHIEHHNVTLPIPSPPVSMAALANGHVLISQSQSGFSATVANTSNWFLELDGIGDGSQLYSAVGYGFTLWELPGTSEVISLGWFDNSGPNTRLLQRRNQGTITWQRGYIHVIDATKPTNYETIAPLAVSDDWILTFEQWRSAFTSAGNTDRDNQIGGLVLRSTSGAGYSYTYNSFPESDVLVDTTEPTQPTDQVLGTPIEFREGYFGAIHETDIYVQGAKVTRYWSGGAVQTDRTYYLWKLDANLDTVWEIETDNLYWKLLADEHGIICGHQVVTSDQWQPFGSNRNYWIERRDTNGVLIWRQSYGPKNQTPYPGDMCFADDGSLFVVGDQHLL